MPDSIGKNMVWEGDERERCMWGGGLVSDPEPLLPPTPLSPSWLQEAVAKLEILAAIMTMISASPTLICKANN